MSDMEGLLRDYKLTKKKRNDFLRYFMNILTEKYHVNRSNLARDLGKDPNYLHDWIAGYLTMTHNTMNMVEGYLNDMYGALLEEELDLHSNFTYELYIESEKEYKKWDEETPKRNKRRLKYGYLG